MFLDPQVQHLPLLGLLDLLDLLDLHRQLLALQAQLERPPLLQDQLAQLALYLQHPAQLARLVRLLPLRAPQAPRVQPARPAPRVRFTRLAGLLTAFSMKINRRSL